MGHLNCTMHLSRLRQLKCCLAVHGDGRGKSLSAPATSVLGCLAPSPDTSAPGLGPRQEAVGHPARRQGGWRQGPGAELPRLDANH
ncbi:hypothetical protein E2562_025039 [Oryza meyeriana var. granulata]|uniref:Uncharacterized protein n=1 Tax=Oryza meyeriana var. granulata TaxID=110450 RepID=A0A6G1D6K0_9ORYZ|nr:hypothetical protein E2562_025039 [Oryza meyeriana var. granulata]